jgi:hypothetical protein
MAAISVPLAAVTAEQHAPAVQPLSITVVKTLVDFVFAKRRARRFPVRSRG